MPGAGARLSSRAAPYRATPRPRRIAPRRPAPAWQRSGVARGAAWRGTAWLGTVRCDAAARHSTREGEPSTEVVGNHPAARVIASLRRGTALSSPGRSLAAASHRVLTRFLVPFSLSPARSLRSSFGSFASVLSPPSPRSLRLVLLPRLQPSLFRRATTVAVARVSNGGRGCLSYTGIRNTVIPLSPGHVSALSSVPSPPTSNADSRPCLPSFFHLPPPSFATLLQPRRRLRHRRGRV